MNEPIKTPDEAREALKLARQIQITQLEAKLCEGTITPAENRLLIELLKRRQSP